MIQVVEATFIPHTKGLMGSKHIGRLGLEIVDVPLYEAIRGGYYLASPRQKDSNDQNLLKTSVIDSGLEQSIPATVDSGIPILDWMGTFIATHGAGYLNRTMTFETDRSKLRHFQTVEFVKSVPSTVSALFKLFDNKDLCAVTDRANYPDLVKMALDKASKTWDRKFIQDLITCISRGSAHGKFVSWADVKAHTYALKPELKGKLKSWDDFYNLELETIFEPADFDQKDDVVISTILKDHLISTDAFFETYCVDGLYDTNKKYLHWSYVAPQKEKKPLPHWTINLDIPGKVINWQVDYSTNTAQLQPENGTTYSNLQKAMAKAPAGTPSFNSLPYKMDWKDLNKIFKEIIPVKIETGLKVACETQLPPVLTFPRVAPIREVAPSAIAHLLGDFGRKINSSKKAEATKAFIQLLQDLYPSFEEKMNDSMEGTPLIRVSPAKVDKKWQTIQSQVLPEYPYELLTNYLMAFYLCRHMRGKSILEAEYESDLYTPEGIFGDLTKSGYPPKDANFGASRNRDKDGNQKAIEALAFVCPFGVPKPLSSTDWHPDIRENVVESENAVRLDQELQVDGVDDLLKDLI